MKEKIKKHFHPSFKNELEKQLDFLGEKEVSWILSDLNELNDENFLITKMKYESHNNTIDLHFQNVETKKNISRTLILTRT